MGTLIINTLLAILIAIIPYLVKYKKKYGLIAGYSDYRKNDFAKNKTLKENANLISNYLFLFCGLIILLSILNLFIPIEITKSKINNDLKGFYIIILSALIAGIAYLVHKYVKNTRH